MVMVKKQTQGRQRVDRCPSLPLHPTMPMRRENLLMQIFRTSEWLLYMACNNGQGG